MRNEFTICVTVACLLQGLNVIAYASHCQLDQHGRPIAGYINICPQMLIDENYDEEKIYWVIFFSCRICCLSYGALTVEERPSW